MLVALDEAGMGCEVIGIDVDAEPDRVRADVTRVAGGLAARAGLDPGRLPEARVDGGYAGPGYGMVTPSMVEAVGMAARIEGLVLDPVYTGKAFAGLMDMVRTGHFDAARSVVFVHTGGSPALFAYPSAFSAQPPPGVPGTAGRPAGTGSTGR